MDVKTISTTYFGWPNLSGCQSSFVKWEYYILHRVIITINDSASESMWENVSAVAKCKKKGLRFISNTFFRKAVTYLLKFLCTVGKKELAGRQLPSFMENAQERKNSLINSCKL